MVLESTMICVDSSDYMRNGDFVPTRLQAQQDAVNVITHSRTRSNPENNVGLLTLASLEVLVTLTADAGRLLSKLHQIQPKGEVQFMSGIRIAHLALKHRQGKNHKMRIIVFIASPIEEDEKELVKLGKKLKKEKVLVDVVNFGEENADANTAKLTAFVNILNGKDGTGCNLVTVSSGALLSDALVHSPIIAGEDGSGAPPAGMAGYEFGVDPNIDPELALALRVSMEEQRARQEREADNVVQTSAQEAGVAPSADTSEEALLARALQMSIQGEEGDGEMVPTPAETPKPADDDLGMMTEDQQIEYALRMSMQTGGDEDTAMETEEAGKADDEKEEDLSEMVNDPEFLQSVLEGLPGVDPSSEAIRNAMGQLTQPKDTPTSDKPKDKDKDCK